MAVLHGTQLTPDVREGHRRRSTPTAAHCADQGRRRIEEVTAEGLGRGSAGQMRGMGSRDSESEYEQGDWLHGAKEHDGTTDAFEEFSEELQKAVGPHDRPPPSEELPGDVMP